MGHCSFLEYRPLFIIQVRHLEGTRLRGGSVRAGTVLKNVIFIQVHFSQINAAVKWATAFSLSIAPYSSFR